MQVIMGVILGAVMTFLFLEIGYSPPAVIEIPAKIKALPEQLIASSFLEDAESALDQRQKAVAILIKYDPGYFIEIDSAIDNRFTSEAVNRIARRKLQLVKGYNNGLDKIINDRGEYPALRESLERLYDTEDSATLRYRMLAKRIRDDELIYKMLQQRFPAMSDEEIARHILTIPVDSTINQRPVN